jgi:Fe-S cluster assembly scaffold protein SufB
MKKGTSLGIYLENDTIILSSPFNGFLSLSDYPNIIQIVVQNGVTASIFNERHISSLALIIEGAAMVDYVDYEEVPTNLEETSKLSIILGKKSYLTLHLFSSVQGNLAKSVELVCKGDESHVVMKSLFLLEGKGQSVFNSIFEHQAPSFASQHVKCLLNDRTLFKFQGEIIVPKNVKGVTSSQLNNNLLLSDDAKAFSKPILKIMSEDVKATHGATFSHLKEDELFYLSSRGLNKQKISSILAKAFCKEIISSVKLSFLGEMIEKRVLHDSI